MRTDSTVIRAVTWNVHGFVGRSGRRDPRSTATALRQLNADIAALQEIDDRSRGPRGTDSFRILRESLGLHGAEARTIRSPDGDYGHVLISRWPISDSVCLDLSVDRREPRVAISCSVESPVGPIRVLAAHLGLSRRERRHQLSIVKRHLDERKEPAAIVLGDFNEWRRIGPATKALCPPFEAAAVNPSFPARRPLFALDRIWCCGPLRPACGWVATEHRHLSDHLPVIADIEIVPGSESQSVRRQMLALDLA